MKVKFWGVRGSIPTPLTTEKLKSRIAAIIQRITPEDLRTPETKEAFMAKMPPYLFGTVGGNTACVEIRPDKQTVIILDAGSGIRELGVYLNNEIDTPKIIHIFMSHFHWDHIQGFPFFMSAFNKKNTVYIYSPLRKFDYIIKEQMKPPYFPITMDAMPSKIIFKRLTGNKMFINNTKVIWKKMKHPCESFSYRLENEQKAVIYATDAEITDNEFSRTEENIRFFQGAKLIILDSQYTLGEAIDKVGWGHTSYSMAVDFASQWKIENLVLFHHEPMYSDKKIIGILNSAQWYLNHQKNRKTNIILAMEGMELNY